MKWKVFITAFVNIAFIAFPYNIIGCGPGIDPYDYYTSFFQNNLSDREGYRPFYYTGYAFFPRGDCLDITLHEMVAEIVP